jgi:hypothetical protein
MHWYRCCVYRYQFVLRWYHDVFTKPMTSFHMIRKFIVNFAQLNTPIYNVYIYMILYSVLPFYKFLKILPKPNYYMPCFWFWNSKHACLGFLLLQRAAIEAVGVGQTIGRHVKITRRDFWLYFCQCLLWGRATTGLCSSGITGSVPV